MYHAILRRCFGFGIIPLRKVASPRCRRLGEPDSDNGV